MTPRHFSFMALLVLVLGIGGVVADDQPPTNLHMVDDHWTAWDPPTSTPEGTEVYIIQRGDTLWDLSNQFYGDPYLWPQLWERNRYILDAHWIYPGDPLIVGVEVTPIDEMSDMSEGGDQNAGLDDDEMHLDRALSAPVPLGSEDDIYCGGYISPEKQVFDYSIIGSEYSYSGITANTSSPLVKSIRYDSYLLNLALGDVVYLDGGRQSDLMPGSIFTVVRPDAEVWHPKRKRKYGHFNRYLGRVRILSTQEETAIAEIIHSCHPITVGDTLKPFNPEPVPLARLSGLVGVNDPVSDEALADAPFIIRADMGNVSIGQGHVVYIDRGVQDVAPGDLFTIYRETPEGLPPLMIGELAVLSVGEDASLAKVLASRFTVHVGDRLDPKLH